MGENTNKFLDDAKVFLEAEGYEILKSLGKEAFGQVFLATKKGESFAVKVIHKQQVKKRSLL